MENLFRKIRLIKYGGIEFEKLYQCGLEELFRTKVRNFGKKNITNQTNLVKSELVGQTSWLFTTHKLRLLKIIQVVFRGLILGL